LIKHKHHIVPKHAGGSDDPTNLVELSIEEHAEAHRLLYEQYGRWQDKVAWLGLAKLIGQDEILKMIYAAHSGSNHTYYGKPRPETTKQKISEALKGHAVSDETRKIWQQQRTGRTVSEETRQKLSKAHKGRTIPEWHKEILRKPKTQEHKEKIRQANKGKVRTEEQRQKNRLARLGKKDSEETKKKKSEAFKGRKITWDLKAITPEANEKRKQALTGKQKPVIICPYCGKSGGAPQMKQWHFDNCKGKK
jgi:hypothetical protein